MEDWGEQERGQERQGMECRDRETKEGNGEKIEGNGGWKERGLKLSQKRHTKITITNGIFATSTKNLNDLSKFLISTFICKEFGDYCVHFKN